MVRRWVVANMRLLPQKWPAPPWEVAGSFRWTQRLNLLLVTAVYRLRQRTVEGMVREVRDRDEVHRGAVRVHECPPASGFGSLLPLSLIVSFILSLSLSTHFFSHTLVWGLGSGDMVRGSGFEIWGTGHRGDQVHRAAVWVHERPPASGFGVWKFQGLGFRVRGSGFRD